MRILLTTSLILICILGAEAQDRHFSQFYASPLTLNPALTGAFDGRYRVAAIYRDQWRGAMENPFVTFSTSLDMKWRMSRNTSRYKDHAAVGVLFFGDKAGPLSFSTTQISVSGAYHKALDLHNTQILSLGFQAGIAQRNVNFGNITFEDQFNGTTGYSDPTSERLPENNYAFADYSVGLNYVYAPKASRMRVFAGAAMHHFMSPSVSFFNRADSDTDLPDNLLARRYSGQLSMQFPLSKGVMLLPRAIFDRQDQHTKLDAGANFRINTSEFKSVALHLGGFVRPVHDQSGSYRVDVVAALVGVELNNVLIGMSYDIFTGRTANFARGAFELSVAYLGEYEDDLILCPKF